LNYWNSVLLNSFSDFFTSKSYFRYFLAKFPQLNPGTVLFLKRLCLMNLTVEDLEFFFGWIWATDLDTGQATFCLEVIRDCAERVGNLSYPAAESVIGFVRSTRVQVVVTSLECLYLLCGSSFCLRAHSVVARISAKKQALVSEIETILSSYPEFFVINCGLCCLDPDCRLSVVPQRIYCQPLWYHFPLLLFIRAQNPLQSQLGMFLARNAIAFSESEIDAVLFSLSLLTSRDPLPIHNLLQYFIQQARTERGGDQAAVILFHTFTSFFHGLRRPISDSNDSRSMINHGLSNWDSLQELCFPDFQFAFSMRYDLEELNQNNIFLQAFQLAELFGKVSAPQLPNSPALFTCDQIRQILSDFVHFGDGTSDKCRSLFAWMKAVLNHRYSQFATELFQVFQVFFVGAGSDPPPYVEVPGRIDSDFNIAKEVKLRRETFLTGYVPYAVQRQKTQNSPERLISSTPPFVPDGEFIAFSNRNPLQVIVEDGRLCLRTRLIAAYIPWADINDFVCLDEKSVQIIVQKTP
jgi:hypothetical protein